MSIFWAVGKLYNILFPENLYHKNMIETTADYIGKANV